MTLKSDARIRESYDSAEAARASQEPPLPDLVDTLRSIVRKWQKMGREIEQNLYVTDYEVCADELSQILNRYVGKEKGPAISD